MEERDDVRGLELPRVDPVGVLQLPGPAGRHGGEGGGRPPSRRLRLAALLLLALFAFVTLATTIGSLGSYCLTSDGPDVRQLPGAGVPASRSASPPARPPRSAS